MSILNLLADVKVYTELGNVEISGVTALVKNIIDFFSFGGYVAVGILLFSLLLKIVPLPLDIYSRASMKKNALKMEKMRPELEKLQRQYAHNKELYNQKMMALYKKEGYSQLASCLPTLITLIFFIIVITAFNQYSTWAKVDMFNQMTIAYNDSFKTNEYITSYELDEDGHVIKATSELNGESNNEQEVKEYIEKIRKPAQKAAADKFFEIQDNYSFLWVKNIWIQDLPWEEAFIGKEAYVNSFTYNEGCSQEEIKSGIAKETVYDIIFGDPSLDEVKNQPNGYLILVVLSILTMLGSQFIMTKSQKAQMELQSVDGMNGQAAQTSKMMMWMMPIMFGIFAFMYTASFSIYLIVSTVFSTLSTVVINFFVEKSFEKKAKKDAEEAYEKRYGHLNKIKK